MAHSVSARKRIRQNESHRRRNIWRLRTLRTSLKEFENSLAQGSVEEAQAAFRKASQLLDKSASKGVIKKNTAARKKSRINARLKARATGADA